MVSQDSIVHMFGRYPTLREDAELLNWIRQFGVKTWHETPITENNLRNIVVQSRDGLNIYALEISITDWEKPDSLNVAQRAVFDTIELHLPQDVAILNLAGKIGRPDIHAIRPVVNFKDSDPSLSWEIERLIENKLETYLIRDNINLLETRFFPILPETMIPPTNNMIPPTNNMIPPTNDWLASNDLHHLASFKQQAEQWAQGASTPLDKARRVFEQVDKRYSYDGSIPNINEFTWSDLLVRDANKYRGVCDEWAVVQISYLRSIGIPATMQFLTFDYGGENVAHACLEFKIGNDWHHMDALWKGFRDRAVYRNNGATNVTVMNATNPRDNRSKVPAWGVVDKPGDGKLHPYLDYYIQPDYPGNARPGYSY